MVTGVFAVTVDVVTVKPAEVAPAGTFTTGWGLATRLLVESVTDAPPAGAGPLRSTVPDTLLPPTTRGRGERHRRQERRRVRVGRHVDEDGSRDAARRRVDLARSSRARRDSR